MARSRAVSLTISRVSRALRRTCPVYRRVGSEVNVPSYRKQRSGCAIASVRGRPGRWPLSEIDVPPPRRPSCGSGLLAWGLVPRAARRLWPRGPLWRWGSLRALDSCQRRGRGAVEGGDAGRRTAENVGALKRGDHQGGQLRGARCGHPGLGEFGDDLADPASEGNVGDGAQTGPVSGGRTAVDGDGSDGAPAATGGGFRYRADTVEEVLHDRAGTIRWQGAQVATDVFGIAARGFERELLFSPGEVVIDRAASRAALSQHVGEGHRGQSVALQQADRRIDHAGLGVSGHREHSLD